MESLNTIKKKNNQFRPNTSSSLRFKKFQMDFDAMGVHILISANFIKKDNYTITVQNGRLLLKINQLKSIIDFKRNSSQVGANEKYMDFDILIPDKQYHHINSALYQNNTLRIHLTKKSTIRRAVALVEAS